jgi:hypothetical protein
MGLSTIKGKTNLFHKNRKEKMKDPFPVILRAIVADSYCIVEYFNTCI